MFCTSLYFSTTQRRCNVRVPEDSAGSGDVRCELLQHQEQERLGAVVRGGRAGAEHLRQKGQVSQNSRFCIFSTLTSVKFAVNLYFIFIGFFGGFLQADSKDWLSLE